MRIYLKNKINEQGTKICKYILNLCIGLSNLRIFTSLVVNLFSDKNGGQLADLHSILNTRKKKICVSY